ncbi:MAG: nucleotide excision repair endonuclease [Candidatus Eisenbacteria bacterium]|nr:nucleotide excision repair endonuclease [Candidatus Eisenbacteria bacterium]MCC7144391.1 nucleotide excision repair endonuclease [Candidatus Eisenbacteria bacterium]
MPTTPLLDRMHAEMGAEDRAYSADELGRAYLKLTGSGPLTAVLIRNLLRPDPRFVECEPGSWRTVVQREPRLDEAGYLLAWVETTEGARFRLHLHRFGQGDCEPLVAPLLDHDLAGWAALKARLDGERWVAWQPAMLARVLQWMDRSCGWGELSAPPLDLLSWTRATLARAGVPVAEARRVQSPAKALGLLERGGEQSDLDGVPIGALGQLLDLLLERFGEWTESQLRRTTDEILGTRPVDWSRFGFTERDIQAVPESAGVYRFFDRDGALLYVGKAARLDRRLQSYFRPFPPEASKREDLLSATHRVEWCEVPSELEALILESRAIRLEGPKRNVQIEVHPLDRFPAGWRWPVVFLAPGEDPAAVSVLYLETPESGFLLRLPRDAGGADRVELTAWLASRREAAGTPTLDRLAVSATDREETWLALRFFQNQGEQCDRLDPTAIGSATLLADALLALAREPNGMRRLVRAG